MTTVRQLNTQELEDGLDHIFESPKDEGVLELIVRRPDVDQREILEEGHLDTQHGLVGDNWLAKGNRHTADGSADPEMQLNIMSARVVALVAVDPDRRQLAGDQLYVDIDLSPDNLPPGARLAIGSAVVEVTEPPHTACKKFAERFGKDAVVFVNFGLGKKLNFRGICAKVVQSGDVTAGDVTRKI